MNLVESMGAAEVALQVQTLHRQVADLINRVEVEAQRADYFEKLYQEYHELFLTMDNISGTDVVITDEGEGWDIAVRSVSAEGVFSHRRSYHGNSFKEALSAFQKGEK